MQKLVNHNRNDSRRFRVGMILLIALCAWSVSAQVAWAQDAAVAPDVDYRELFRSGGVIGMVILALSIFMVALIVEHLLSIRRKALMPPGLAETVHELIEHRQFQQAREVSLERSSFLGNVLAAGLEEASLGYTAVEKSMEESATLHAARLFRKIEYLSVIGTLAPMLGLLGTVWGMILAFREFEAKANPQVAELAPGIYKALVTTLLGLIVAVTALASYSFFRNRIDELVAQSSQLAEHIFADFKRSLAARRMQARTSKPRVEQSQT